MLQILLRETYKLMLQIFKKKTNWCYKSQKSNSSIY